jgi:SAM-dependent methyltransferase
MPPDASTSERRQSFGAIAQDYDRFRPGPPADVVASLLRPDGHDVLELGAGTGALTRLLVEQVAHVRAIEPDARMRAVLAAQVPTAEVVAGQAEDIPAPDASFDTVIAASAWHWVDPVRAVPEVARVLRPGGWFSLLWNGPDRSIDWMRSLWAGGADLNEGDAQALDAVRRDRHNVILRPDDPFSEPERWVSRWTKPMSKDELVGLAGTYSAVIVMDDGERNEYLAAVRRFLDTDPTLASLDVIDVPMRCRCWRAIRL